MPDHQAPENPVAVFPEVPRLQVGGLDERGNTIKYICVVEHDYIIYYGRLELPAVKDDTPRWKWAPKLPARYWRMQIDLDEGIQAQLSPDPDKRKTQRRQLLPLGIERRELQLLLHGWPLRLTYDADIAIALQMALQDEGTEAIDVAIQSLKDAKKRILAERLIAGKAQYFRLTLVICTIGMFLSALGQHNWFEGSGNFWLGTQMGLLGAVLSIATGIRRRTLVFEPDINEGMNLFDCTLRMVIGALSGGALVLLFSCGVLPPWHTVSGDLDANSTKFAMILGIIAGFVEKLVPNMLEDHAEKLGGGSPQTASDDPSKPHGPDH